MSLLGTLKKAIHPRHPLRLAWHHAKSFVAALMFGFPAKKLFVIGITGTDGKTTTVSMVTHILKKSGKKVGSMSTASFTVNDIVETNPTQKTAPKHFEVQHFLRQLVNSGCEYAVLEYSSHGIDQGRTNFTWPRVAGITNISPEHLDYHGTMENYIETKGKLFQSLRSDGCKVLNADDQTYETYKKIPTHRTITYSARQSPAENESLVATDIVSTPTETKATIRHSTEGSFQLTMPIAGRFNVDNALCAVACAHAAGIPLGEAVKSLSDFHGVPGRIERIDAGQSFKVFLDFTVTPASYEKTLGTLKAMLQPGQKLMVLTGSAGDRMREKRPVVGKICSELADVVVVANEDPYTENPEKIIDEVFAGVDQSKTEAHKIVDRREAIEFLFKKAQPGDIVLLAGKGNDTTMWTDKGQVPWNERDIAKEILTKLLRIA